MAFAKQLLGLDFNPYALDVLLVYPYDAPGRLRAVCGNLRSDEGGMSHADNKFEAGREIQLP